MKQGYIVGITQISFVPRYDEVDEAAPLEDDAQPQQTQQEDSKTADAQ